MREDGREPYRLEDMHEDDMAMQGREEAHDKQERKELGFVDELVVGKL